MNEKPEFPYNRETNFSTSNNNQNTNSDDRNVANNEHDPFESNPNWFSDQSGRSIESRRSGEMTGERNAKQNEENVDGPSTLGDDIVQKIVSIDQIVAREHQRDGNLLDVDDPLPVKKSVVKMTKKNFVNFQNASIRNMKNGTLTYLSLNPEMDDVHMECSFGNLEATGTFKSNLAYTKRGQFVVDMDVVLSNVTASFHRGKAAVGPVTLLAAETYVVADDRRDVDAVIESVGRKYRYVLERAVAAEVYKATFKGVVSELKAKMEHAYRRVSNEPAAKLYDLDWTEGSLNIQMSNASSRSWRPANRTIDFVSYTRKNHNAYEMRFDVRLKRLLWISDLTTTYNGRRVQRSRSLKFVMEDVQICVIVLKSIGSQECRQIETDVHARGLQYDLNEQQLPSFVKSTVELRLPRLIERSFTVYLKDLIKRDVCHVSHTRPYSIIS